MEQQYFGIKVNGVILPGIYLSTFMAEQKKNELIKETLNMNINIIPVSSTGQEILFG